MLTNEKILIQFGTIDENFQKLFDIAQSFCFSIQVMENNNSVFKHTRKDFNVCYFVFFQFLKFKLKMKKSLIAMKLFILYQQIKKKLLQIIFLMIFVMLLNYLV